MYVKMVINGNMIKICYSLLLLMCLTNVSLAQTKDTYYGVVITKVITDGSSPDTTRLLYCRTISGSLLSVYVVEGGRVSACTAYRIGPLKDAYYLYARTTHSEDVSTDSLRISFKDAEQAVLINQRDRYVLYPGYYKTFKQEITSKHSVIALLGLLGDAIGDYPIENALPLTGYTPQLGQFIKHATILTQRSQADITDTWTCTYRYNKKGKLAAVSATDGKLIRFSKKIIYNGTKAATIQCYRNIEDRQVTDKTVSYNRDNRNVMEWQEHVLETGKNRESDILNNFTWHDLGMFRNIDLSDVEISNLFKPTHNEYTKKHID
jgi:hypothetical protein